MSGIAHRLAGFAAMMLVAATGFAQVPDAARGRALYENHCVLCHSGTVHARAKRLLITRTEVREIVEKWQTQQRLGWSTSDLEDVVEFLNRTHYKFD